MTPEVRHFSVSANGIRLHVAEQGQGPLVLFCHGWPELWSSWEHQLTAVASAGFRAVAPDMRGYGRSDAPEAIGAYTILHLVGDMVSLVAALDEREAIIVGHDWGAIVAWHAALLRPDIFRAIVAMSAPLKPRGPMPPLQALRQAGIDDHYRFYFQTPGVAEAEFERDIPATMRRIFYSGSGDAPRGRIWTLTVSPGEGYLDHTIDPDHLPPWLKDADLANTVAEYQRTGFRGGLNWYRNIDYNWELLAPWQNAMIHQPALFIGGTRDPAVRGVMGGAQALNNLSRTVPGIKRTVLVKGAGHWVQHEYPIEVNSILLQFLHELQP